MSSIVQSQNSRFASASGMNARVASWFVLCMDALIEVADFLERAAAGRRALRQLAKADDRMLKDIGLNRSDLRNAAAEPLYSDPTKLLAGHVCETRTHCIHRLNSDRLQPSRYY